MPDIKLGSLFDGIGVFPLAASRCGIRPVWASEIEKAPISITKRHFPDMVHLGDITKVDGGKIPPVHVITFGSPCQNLSLIGNRSGLAGAKSSLFYQAFRIIQEMRDATDNLYPAMPGLLGIMYTIWCLPMQQAVFCHTARFMTASSGSSSQSEWRRCASMIFVIATPLPLSKMATISKRFRKTSAMQQQRSPWTCTHMRQIR